MMKRFIIAYVNYKIQASLERGRESPERGLNADRQMPQESIIVDSAVDSDREPRSKQIDLRCPSLSSAGKS